MPRRKVVSLVTLVLVGSIALAGCAAPEPEVVIEEVPVTIEVTKIVEGTPETVIEEVIVTATPEMATWLAKLDAIREILTSEGRTLAQGALAWIWGRSERTIPIPGFRTIEQVQENAQAMEYGPLTGGQMAEIAAILGRDDTL